MKYMIMLLGSQRDYDDLSAMSAEDAGALRDFMVKWTGELVESGEYVDGRGLTAPVYARRIQLQAGASVVTDGPYAETQEVLAGYTIVECDSFDRATEIAARLVHAPGSSGSHVDVRPIVEGVDDLVG